MEPISPVTRSFDQNLDNSKRFNKTEDNTSGVLLDLSNIPLEILELILSHLTDPISQRRLELVTLSHTMKTIKDIYFEGLQTMETDRNQIKGITSSRICSQKPKTEKVLRNYFFLLNGKLKFALSDLLDGSD